jgi:hypothetical protein
MPTAKHGKICYIEMPARDAQTSADFYQRALGGRSERAAMVRLHLRPMELRTEAWAFQ